MRVEIRIGKNWGTKYVGPHAPADNLIARTVEDFLMQEVLHKGVSLSRGQIRRMTKQIEAQGNREIDRLMPFVARHLIGFPVPNVGKAQITSQTFLSGAPGGLGFNERFQFMKRFNDTSALHKTLYWNKLSDRYMESKGNRNFWIDTGHMLSVVSSNPQRLRNTFGGVTATYMPNENVDRSLPRRAAAVVGDIKIAVMPKLHQAAAPALVTGDWTSTNRRMFLEKRLFSGHTLEKLSPFHGSGHSVNPDSERSIFRPLFQPAVQFWLLYRIPRQLGQVVARYMKQTTRSR